MIIRRGSAEPAQNLNEAGFKRAYTYEGCMLSRKLKYCVAADKTGNYWVNVFIA